MNELRMHGAFVVAGLIPLLFVSAPVHAQEVAGNAVSVDSGVSANRKKVDERWKGQMLLEIQLLEAMRIECPTQADQSETGRGAPIRNSQIPETTTSAKRDEKLTCVEQADQAIQRLGNQLGIGITRRSAAPQDDFEREYERALLAMHQWFEQVVRVLRTPEALTHKGFTEATRQFQRDLDTFKNHYIRFLEREDKRDLSETLFEAGDILIASAYPWGRQVEAEQQIARLAPHGPSTALSATQAARDTAAKQRAAQWNTVQQLVSEATTLVQFLRPPVIPPSKPRLADGGQTLVLIEESREPAAARRPEISVGVAPTTRTPEIRVSGRDIRAPSDIDVMCREGALPGASFVSFSGASERKVATFAITARVAVAMINSPPCLLQVAELLVPIRADLLSTVWGDLRNSSRGDDRAPSVGMTEPPGLRASREGRYADVESSLMQGAAPSDRGMGGETALHWAAAYGHPAIVKLLLSHGAEINAKDAGHETPLHYAAANGQSEVAGVLLDKQADPHAKNGDAMTPLHLAAAHGHTAVVNLLLAHRVRVDVQDIGGTTPLHLACGYGRKDIVLALLRAGAVATLKDVDGHTPFDLAQANDHADVAALINTFVGTK